MTNTTASGHELVIYHVEQRRSIRVIWLCEELGIPYQLVFKAGDIFGSLNLIRSVNPLMPLEPTVDFRGQIFVESGGILDLLLAEYGNGRLVPAKGAPDLWYHHQWMHFAEGTAMYRIWSRRYAAMVAGIPIENVPVGYKGGDGMLGTGKLEPLNFLVGVEAVFDYLEDFLSKKPYFGGADFSAADIMMHFPIVTSVITAQVDGLKWRRVREWRKKVEGRPAYQRAMDAALPNGYDEQGNAYGLPITFADPPRIYERPR